MYLQVFHLLCELIGCLTLRWRKRVYTWKGNSLRRIILMVRTLYVYMQCHSHLSVFMKNVSVVRWPTTVTSNTNYSHQIQNPDIKYKLLTSKSNTNYSSHQIQNPDIKYKLLTSKTNCSHQIQNPDIKYKLLTPNTNCSHQIQITHIKYKNKIKPSAVGERKLCPVFTRPWPDRHFVPAHGIVVGKFCSTCGRTVDNCNFCSNCRKGKLKL